jgi:hypothetical protein
MRHCFRVTTFYKDVTAIVWREFRAKRSWKSRQLKHSSQTRTVVPVTSLTSPHHTITINTQKGVLWSEDWKMLRRAEFLSFIANKKQGWHIMLKQLFILCKSRQSQYWKRHKRKNYINRKLWRIFKNVFTFSAPNDPQKPLLVLQLSSESPCI